MEKIDSFFMYVSSIYMTLQSDFLLLILIQIGSPMRPLITGGAGQLDKYLVQLISHQGCEAMVIDLPSVDWKA